MPANAHILWYNNYVSSQLTAQTLSFSVPFVNDIRIVNPDAMYETVSYLYYGDEIDLRFWATLKLEFGHPDGQPYFTLQPGYLYRYNAWGKL